MDRKGVYNFKKIRAVILCLAIFFFLLSPVSVLATDYYVKTPASGGDDNNAGTSWAEAKETIQAAMSLAITSGDKVYVAAGTYTGTVSFPEAHNVQLLGGYPAAGGGAADPWANTTIIQGGSPVVSIPGILVGTQRSYIGLVIDGFTIKNGSKSSPYAAGIQSYSAGLTIKRCIIEDNSGTGSAYAGGIYILSLIGDGASVIFKLEESIIRNNTGLYAGGLFFDCIGYPKFQMTNCLVYGNSATDTGSNYAVGGIAIGSGSQTIAASSITNCTIADNTSAHPSAAVGGIAVNTESWTSPIDIKNSIIWHSSLDDIYAYGGSALSISYSDVHDSDSGTGVIHTNPAFVGAGDYHLTAGSGGCINGGTASGAPSTDLEGTTRVGYDMGCYEYAPPPAPDITVTDDKGAAGDLQIPFGSVTVGDSSDAIVTITNDASATDDLVIGTITDPAAPFSINATACNGQTLTPGSSCNCTVTFAPTETGDFNSSFNIPSNDPDENPVTVQVSGTGTAVPAPEITVTDNKGATDDLQVPFGNVTEGETANATVTVTNDGNQDLVIGAITSPAVPFSIDATSCSGQTLAPGASCDCTVSFDPTATGGFSGSFDIPSNDPDENPVTVQVSGTGVSATMQYTLAIAKTGQGTVTPDVGDHDYDDGTVVDLTATPDEGWTFVSWDGNVADNNKKTTTITMNSDKTVTATFAVDDDNDGFANSEEQGPSGTNASYDRDGSGTPDSQEANVASGHTFDDAYYVTLAVPDTQELNDVAAVDNPSPSNSPSGATFPYGFFEFTVTGIAPPGSATTVKLYLPAGQNPNTYWKYGPTPTDGTNHWYEFIYDGTTGAEINYNVITLHFVDGQRGDDDLTSNGTIVDQGAPSNPTATSGSNGGCFIATSAYGSYMEPHVLVLRDFRDRFLLNNSAGKAFVRFYYYCSPPVADFIAKYGVLRAVVRVGLLPLVVMSNIALHTTALQKIVLILITLGFLLSVGMGIRSFRRRETLS